MLDALVTATSTTQRWMDGDHMDGSGWWVMGLGMIVVTALVIALVYFLVRESRRHGGRDRAGALDTLDHRFARGEIDEDEYRKRREILRS